MPANSLIVGVDLSPIKPIPRVITFQGDITTDKCRATIRQHLKTWKADTVLHDGAPNVGTAWNQDSFNQAELVLQSMKLATDFLIEGGTFVTKVFRSKDYNSLLWVFNQLFDKVEATKPPSSRNVSAEIFVVCRGFKAPKKIDPRFLDPQSVFAELANPTPNNEAKVYNPETKKRKRDGYEEGDWTQFKEVSASEFIQTNDPLAILGSCNRLTFTQPPNGDVALAALEKLPETTEDIKNNAADLKVLGRKEFKTLLKWRLRVREIFGFASKKDEKPDDEVAEVEPMDEELRIQEELQGLKEKESSKRKRERRRENERKRKEIVRMQMNMMAPMDIGMEQDGPMAEGSMFRLKSIDKEEALRRIARGNMATITKAEKQPEVDGGAEILEDDDDDEAEDGLEQELDAMYDAYRGRRANADPKVRSKRAREEHDDEWEGVSADEKGANDSESELEEESGDEGDEDVRTKLLTDLDDDDEPTDSALSKRARNFFNQDIFQGVLGDAPEEEAPEVNGTTEKSKARTEKESSKKKAAEPAKKEVKEETKKEAKKASEPEPMDIDHDSDESEEEVDFELEKRDDEDDWEEIDKKREDGKLGMFLFVPPIFFFFLVLRLTFPPRHRHHHGGGHDARARPRHGQEDQERPRGRGLQQVGVP